MSEGSRDEVDDSESSSGQAFERELREYMAWARRQTRRDEWFRWLTLLGLLSFNGGFVVWNLHVVRHGWAWINAAAVVVHSVVALYLAWKCWRLWQMPVAGEGGR